MNIVISPQAYLVRTKSRGWFERLFSRPWRPFVKMTTWMEPQAYMFRESFTGAVTVVCHPALAVQVKTLSNMPSIKEAS